MSQSEKKRKRSTEDNEEGPSKNPAPDLSSSNVKLNFVSEPHTLGPVLASTPGLVISPHLTFNPYSKARPKARNRFKPVYSDSELLLHSTTHPTIDYTAREGAAGQDDNLKHYVGIYDHNTAEVSVVEVRSMSVRSSVRQKNPDPQEEAQSYQAKRKDLIEAFGSKKSLQRLEEYETNVKMLGGPPPNMAALEASLRNKGHDGEELTAFEKNQLEQEAKDRPLPKPDMDATVLSEAYPLSTLVENSKETLSALQIQPWQKAVQKNEAINLSHRFPASRVVRVVQEKDIQKIKVLQYLLILLQFHAALKKPKGLRDNASLPKKDVLYKAIPAAPNPAVVDAIKRKFVPEGSVLPVTSLILLRTTILALTLHIDNFTTDIRDIVRDLDIDMPTLQKHYKDLGCKPYKPVESEFTKYNVQTKAQANALKIFRLKLPLEFPKARTKGVGGTKGRRY